MNIFYLDKNPSIAAEMHCDMHVVKMIVETAQMLCTKYHECGIDAPYAKTHYNHPCSIWARYGLDNYKWLLRLGKALCREYTKRYKKIHKSQQVIYWCYEHINDLKFNEASSMPPLCMPEDCKLGHDNLDDVVLSYRLYYLKEKNSFAKWKFSQKPDWYG